MNIETVKVESFEFEQIKKEAVAFLAAFKASDFEDPKLYAKFKTYRMMHKKNQLPRGSYEFVLSHLGWGKIETWNKGEGA